MRIMFAWEFGAGLGHLARLAPWMEAFRRRGVVPVLAVRDLQAVAAMPAAAQGLVVQAPGLRHAPLGGREEIYSHAEVLLDAGYGSDATLGALVRGWRSLFELCDARAVVADYAPTAVLAARLMGLPVMRVDDGFTLPPDGAAGLAFGDEARRNPARFRLAESRVVEALNGVLGAQGPARIDSSAVAFEADLTVLATFAELDHYRPCERREAYSGHFETPSVEPYDWGAAPGPRILAYLNPRAPNFEATVRLLARVPAQTRLYASGMTRQQSDRAQSGLAWSARPLPFAAAAAECDLVVGQGGHGTVCNALLAGKPLLLLPTGYEQVLTARNVEALGAGRWIHPAHDDKMLKRALLRAIDDDAAGVAARSFAERYAGNAQNSTVRLAEYADRFVAIAGARASR